MNTELKSAVMATDKDAQYDNSAKRLVGFNTENQEMNEGLVRFDIVFYVRMKDGLSQIIINVEAQKDEPGEYEILNRAVFYVSRLVSSQKERDFENSSYDDIKSVYSIWICMNIIMIGLAKELPEHDETYELHRLLGALLSRELTIDEKLDIIGNEYDIPLEENFRKDMSTMCNLSQGVKEEGIAIGRREGLEEGRREGYAEGEAGLIMTMYKNGLLPEQIASATDKTVEEIKTIIQGKGIFDEI